MNPQYKVVIERQPKKGFLDQPIWLSVRCDGETVGYGWYYKENTALKKALKYIGKHQQQLDSGTQFGVLFSSEGSITKVEKALRKAL